MEKYGIKIFYPYNITEHIHHEGDGHHFEGDGHEDDVMQAIEARKRFLLVSESAFVFELIQYFDLGITMLCPK